MVSLWIYGLGELLADSALPMVQQDQEWRDVVCGLEK
jgi:hypothetical protein